jgi:hypothetical protein
LIAPPAEQERKTIFNPNAADEDIQKAINFLVSDRLDIPLVWHLIKPCRSPEAAGIQRTAMDNTALNE